MRAVSHMSFERSSTVDVRDFRRIRIPDESLAATSPSFADSASWIGQWRAPDPQEQSNREEKLKIEKHSSQGKTTIRLIGRFQSEHVDELKKQIDSNGTHLALELQEVTLVDLGVVQFLALCEVEGMELLHCPAYIREWIRRERQGFIDI
jgi:hypothetical protein